MTMSILRKISVNDIDLCPLNKIQKTGCGNHIELETDSVCLVRTRWSRSCLLRVSSGHLMGHLGTPPCWMVSSVRAGTVTWDSPASLG